MLEHVVDLAIRLVQQALPRAAAPARPAAPRPDALRVQATEKAYAAWVVRHLLERDDEARGHRGRLEGHDVVVCTGLDESTPGAVEVEMRIDHGQTTPVLLGPKSAGENELEKSLGGLFDDASLAPDLRSVAITAGGVRIRLRALTRPRTVEIAVRAAADAVRHARLKPPLAPYR